MSTLEDFLGVGRNTEAIEHLAIAMREFDRRMEEITALKDENAALRESIDDLMAENTDLRERVIECRCKAKIDYAALEGRLSVGYAEGDVWIMRST